MGRGYRGTAVVLAVVASACLPGTASAGCADANLRLTSANGARVATAIVCRVNEERGRRGVRRLRVASSLAKAARAHTRDMARRDFFDHVAPDGSTPSSRARAAGYRGGGVGENIAAGNHTANDVMRTWMRSTGHRSNILSRRYRRIGVGAGRGGQYGTLFTQVFG